MKTSRRHRAAIEAAAEYASFLDAPAARSLAEEERARIAAIEAAICESGWSLLYQRYCESPDTPGMLGQIRGVTDRNRQLVRIGMAANPAALDIIDILEHELRHVREPEWDCGSRDVLGRGGPARSKA